MPRSFVTYNTIEFENQALTSLQELFGSENVERPWDVAKNSRDDFTRELYCPEIDLAVGPFNVNRDGDGGVAIKQTFLRSRALIEKLLSVSHNPVGNFEEFLGKANPNPRCFMAVEVEKSGTRKHMLGDMVNASIIGMIGIVIPLKEGILRGFKGIKKYLEFATRVEKSKYSFDNVLIVGGNDFLDALEQATRE